MPKRDELKKHGKDAWEFLWDWRAQSKRHLELGWRYTKRHPFSVFSVVLITALLTLLGTNHWDNITLESVKNTYQTTNSFLNGQLKTTKDELDKQKSDGIRKITEDATEIANLKTDYNERLRTKDVEIQQLTSDRDNALQRISIMETMPAGLLSIYTNLNANAPTNLNELASILRDITNSIYQSVEMPKFKLFLNGKPVLAGVKNCFISTNRSMFFLVINDSEITADRLTIGFQAKLETTNFITTHDWDANKLIVDDKDTHIWVLQAGDIIGGHNRFSATTFEISTNYTDVKLGASMNVFSSTSKIQIYYLIFIFADISDADLQKLAPVLPGVNLQKY